MTRKLFALSAVVLLSLTLGGCNIQTIRDYLQTGISIINSALPVIARDIDYACATLNAPVDPAAPPACTVKISKLRAAWYSACQNTALLTDNVAGNYVAKIRSDIKDAAKSC